MNESIAPVIERDDRWQLIAEFEADAGDDWMAGNRPGTFGCHELLDRTALVADLLERHIREHPACVQNEEWFRLASQAATALHELYQQVGAAHLTVPT